MKNAQAIRTWANTQGEENAMNDDHRHLWQQLIRHTEEPNLSQKSVLDYGCNQGGFLRLLYTQKPFAHALGVDIAEDSLAAAQENVKDAPIAFTHVADLSNRKNEFDIAFSHEVIYLLPDLAAHAALIKSCLKPGGVYYAAIGCHTDNPQWPRWKEIIASYSNVTVQDYSLDDYAAAFFDAGFAVSAKPYSFTGFVPLKKGNAYFPKIRDSLDYHTTHKTLFRFVRGA